MTEADKDKLIRQYAAGEITWRSLRERGFDDYVQVLGALGELGLRPPIAPWTGRTGPRASAAGRCCARPCGRTNEQALQPDYNRYLAADYARARGFARRAVASRLDGHIPDAVYTEAIRFTTRPEPARSSHG